ncbi:unnamed protein product [Fraxinus pennsylvanica]|uniref:Uncharacterized protein n=1 Tax=Fraxinus pennsylvanica TaxID=56036 RepID=A0AAD1ZK54_9LAMI|nr:unnamed protein product [Fraxinus pennsylvanica]
MIVLKGREKLPVDFLPQREKHGVEKVKDNKDPNNSRTEQQKRKPRSLENKDEMKERGHWTEDMRDDALEPVDLYSRNLTVVDLGPKAEDVKKPINPFVFLARFLLGAIAATYFVLIPIYMWLKDQIVPKGVAWLAYVVKCLVKSYNERNSCFVMLRHGRKEKVFAHYTTKTKIVLIN